MTAATPDEHEAEQAEFHRWLDHEERLDEYLRVHRPEPEPPFEWTEWDDLQERLLNGEYDDDIYPEDEPGNAGLCPKCGFVVVRTATRTSGWITPIHTIPDRLDYGPCPEHAPRG